MHLISFKKQKRRTPDGYAILISYRKLFIVVLSEQRVEGCRKSRGRLEGVRRLGTLIRFNPPGANCTRQDLMLQHDVNQCALSPNALC